MPTGYTAAVSDGKVTTLEQFALDCARQFGACITLRDEPGGGDRIPEKFEPSDFNARRRVEDEVELHRVEAMTPAEAQSAAEAEREAEEAQERRYAENRRQTRERYEAMLAKVHGWRPPTEEHDGLKNFMVQQLRESIEFDCRDWLAKATVAPRPSGAEWRERKMAQLRDSIARNTKAHMEEVARCEKRTAWVRALRDSLRSVPQ